MTSSPSDPLPDPQDRRLKRGRRDDRDRPDHGPVLMTALLMLATAWIISQWTSPTITPRLLGQAAWVDHPQPLVMRGGDPYIRALMRTISAAESNMDRPYNLLYGGKVFEDLSQHPDICVTIVTGPNQGDCTTAAGRYQFLNTTWESKAKKYHPRPPGWLQKGGDYSFQPQFQDAVVYYWLSDTDAWGVDISALLQQGRLDEVLKMLSGTWTSLGYGIETNSMTARLPEIYQAMLREELQQAGVIVPRG